MSRNFIGLESSSTLKFVSERDPDEIVQTHMLSWAFADHICHKFQQGIYQLIWCSAQVDFMLGSELCSALDVLVRKKTCDLHDFLCILHETEWPLVLQTTTTITIHQLILFSLSDRLIFRNSLSSGLVFLEKTSTCHMYSTLLRIAQRVSTCIIHVQLAESRPEGQCLVRNK